MKKEVNKQVEKVETRKTIPQINRGDTFKNGTVKYVGNGKLVEVAKPTTKKCAGKCKK